MQRKWFEKNSFSFTVVDDDDFDFDESIAVENARDVPSPTMSVKDDRATNLQKKVTSKDMTDSNSDDDDEEEEDESPKHIITDNEVSSKGNPKIVLSRQSSTGITTAGPSNRNSGKHMIHETLPVKKIVSTDSESDDTDDLDRKHSKAIPGEYDPALYEHLDVNDESKELFQYITKYIPQNLNLDYKFKPFIPEFLPAVGDVDAFLKIIQPEQGPSGEAFNLNQSLLGLNVLDEPAANQSDPALLHLQLRASSVHVSQTTNVVVKKVENIEKNFKVIDKWIKDISDLHKSKTSPVVKYSDPMPDLDVLMQEWPEKLENTLKLQGFPSNKIKATLTDYIKIICCLFDIPVYKNKLQSLHLFFCLYAAVKNSQLYRATHAEEKSIDAEGSKVGDADQLILE